MYASLLTEMYLYAVTQQVTTLSGINAISNGYKDPINFQDSDFPALCFTFATGSDHHINPFTVRSLSDLGQLAAYLYTVSTESYADAEREALRLLWSDDKTTGLLRAFTKKTGFGGLIVQPATWQPTLAPVAKSIHTYRIRVLFRIQGVITLPA